MKLRILCSSWDFPSMCWLRPRALYPKWIHAISHMQRMCEEKLRRNRSGSALLAKVARVLFCCVCKTKQCAPAPIKPEESLSNGMQNNRYESTAASIAFTTRKKKKSLPGCQSEELLPQLRLPSLICLQISLT